MKTVRTYILAGVAALALTSCNDYLTTVPKDAMSPSTTWKTGDDAEKFLVGCYDGWEDGGALLYWDAGSDFAYNNFPWEGFTNIGNGSLSPSSPGCRSTIIPSLVDVTPSLRMLISVSSAAMR